MIEVKNVTYRYNTYIKNKGFIGSLHDFLNRKTIKKEALTDINFSIQKGEFVALLGPNGAGKTTLIKILTGIIASNEGNISCRGFNPYKKEKAYLSSIGVVLGQKSQLIWDLPPIETLEMLKIIYNINEIDYQTKLDYMLGMLNLKEKELIPVRKLSLGERMKFEIICSLIHSPDLLFLDEPTIGLDIISQKNIRDFLKHLNKEFKTTIILTSHNMDDIERLCKRVLILKDGNLIDDLPIELLKTKYAANNFYKIEFKEHIPKFLDAYKIQDNLVRIPEDTLNLLSKEIDFMSIRSLVVDTDSFEDIIYKIFNEQD